MDEQKPFPVPWRIEGEFDADVSVSIMSADDRLVCEIEPFCEEWTEAEIANVRLIAAAPELLAALNALWSGSSLTEIMSKAEIMSEARAAIAKAEEPTQTIDRTPPPPRA